MQVENNKRTNINTEIHMYLCIETNSLSAATEERNKSRQCSGTGNGHVAERPSDVGILRNDFATFTHESMRRE